MSRAPTPAQRRQALLAVRRFRTNFLFGTLLLLFVVLLGRLAKLQLVDGARFQAEAEAKHASAHVFKPRRGSILDRFGRPLATPKPARRIGIDPTQISDPRTFAIVLSDYLGGAVTPVAVTDAMRAARAWAREKKRPLPQYRVLVPYVDEPLLVDRLDELKGLSIREKRRMGIYGVVVDMSEGRQYPNGEYAAHVLGEVPREKQTAGTGAESAFDDVLSGAETHVALRRDGRRRAYAERGAIDRSASRGEDVELSLDVTIQHFLETELDALVRTWEPTQACGIVLDPHSGHILALANRPTFDPNRQPANQNIAIQGLYEPGSFFKPFTVAWALQYAAVGPDEQIDMPERTMLPRDPHPVRDTHYVGPGSVDRLLAESSNTGAALLGHRLGPERMRGLFETLYPDRHGGTRCGLPYEKSGGPRRKTWPWWLAHRAAFGQGFRITPIQMACSFAAFARDDGRSVRPTILANEDHDAAGVQVCEPPHLPIIRAGLEGCAAYGTAQKAFAGSRYTVAAKTATAQQWGTWHGIRCQFNNCSVAAYAPAAQPQVVVFILAQVPPAKEGYGGSVAGSHVRTVIERTLDYWKVSTQDRTGVLAARGPGEPR